MFLVKMWISRSDIDYNRAEEHARSIYFLIQNIAPKILNLKDPDVPGLFYSRENTKK
jgi:hypothetical protein